MVDRVIERTPSVLRLERTLTPDRDRYLRQHRLHDVPILPFTFGCELLAEAAALFAPEWVLDRLEDVHVETPVKFFRDTPAVIRVSATLISDDGETRVLAVETRSDFFLRDVALQRDRLHHRAVAVLRRSRRKAGLPMDIRERPGLVKSLSLFQGAREPVELGAVFWNAAWIQTFEREVIGSIRAPRHHDLFRTTSYPVFQIDPLVLDSAFQIAANWDGHHNRVVPIPVAVDRITIGEPRDVSQATRVRAAVVRVEDPDVFYDLVIAGENGAPLMKVSGLRMRRVGPLERDGDS